ncbi:hypothetical protein PUN4_450061 [Paraburkholderia unamae]|nr:hypothetical protein PUN4_450061 [Paraburkholderia unamae]
MPVRQGFHQATGSKPKAGVRANDLSEWGSALQPLFSDPFTL